MRLESYFLTKPESYVLTKRDVYLATREALQDEDEDTIGDYQENETKLMQKAIASILASEQFELLFKKLVKEALVESGIEQDKNQERWTRRQIHAVLDEREEAERQRQLKYNRIFYEQTLEPFIQAPTTHYRLAFHNALHCGADWADNVSTSNTAEITCKRCKASAKIE